MYERGLLTFWITKYRLIGVRKLVDPCIVQMLVLPLESPWVIEGEQLEYLIEPKMAPMHLHYNENKIWQKRKHEYLTQACQRCYFS